ncbi:DUF397 domain-containing protein [Streptomyces johnsoniae]|uniref:DUF397 domain-containing protein n=1 Tax=Streptomyces johnsoniae TaxID=3075532 RepID=A0ABU2S4L3_9ACTN|nr:DUF397 domain-containing protein [Streptomyces sp. DSM 41886]MDT0443907.1 DUF397 domain-containing protein [Streptomyces sp. DSM 41886]
MSVNPPAAAEFQGWHTSSYSDNGSGCIERGGSVTGRQAVRDSKDPAREVALVFGRQQWQAFVSAAVSGDLS